MSRLAQMLVVTGCAATLTMIDCGHSVCATSDDCGWGDTCVFSADGGCSASGVCVGHSNDCPLDLEQVCGCDGRLTTRACADRPGVFFGSRVNPDQSCLLVDAGPADVIDDYPHFDRNAGADADAMAGSDAAPTEAGTDAAPD